MYWQYAREMSHIDIWIAADKARRAVVPCRVTRQWHTETAMLSELLRKFQEEAHAQRQSREDWQTSTSTHQLQANQDKEKPVRTCRHPTVGKLGVFRSLTFCFLYCAATTSYSMTSSGGKQSTSSKSNWQARTYKWWPDAQVQGIRLKSPANLGIPETEWHESIHSILRKAVPRHTHTRTHTHTPCHKGLGSCIQVLASHLHHLSRCQDTWQGQRHASKQRTTLYSMAQASSSRGNCLWCHVDSHRTFSPMPRNMIFHRKMLLHKAGQQNLWRSYSSHPKANQSQNTWPSIVAGAHRRQ